MKQLIIIIGPNGVGKTTSAKEILQSLPHTAYVDSDWCRMTNPFEFTKITKNTVENNIYCLLSNYLNCNDIDTVLFTYAWHGERKEIYENVMARLKEDGIKFKESIFVLKCSKDENIKRARKDGRDEVRIDRGIKNTFDFYDGYDYPTIDTTLMTPSQVAAKIISDMLIE